MLCAYTLRMLFTLLTVEAGFINTTHARWACAWRHIVITFLTRIDAGLMCPRPMCPRPKILGCCAPGTKRPLDIVSLTDASRPWTASSMELAPSAAIAASVGLRHLMDQWGVWPASPTPLTRFIGLAPLRRMHARPTHRIKSKGWDGSARGKIAKGHFIQGMQHPRIFGRGHIGRGWTNEKLAKNIQSFVQLFNYNNLQLLQCHPYFPQYSMI